MWICLVTKRELEGKKSGHKPFLFSFPIIMATTTTTNNNNFIYIALKFNNCPKRYLITKKIYIYIKNLKYKISTIYNIIQI